MRLWRRLTGSIGPVGVAVLVVTALGLGLYGWLFVRSMIRAFTLDHLTTLLFGWQTQTGAAFALAAALIGASVIVQQTTAAENRAETRRERRASALKAVLPLLLAELIDYAGQCAKIAGEVLQHADRRAVVAQHSQPGLFRPPSDPAILDASDWPPVPPPSSAAPAELPYPRVDQQIPPLPSGFVGQLTDLIEAIPAAHGRPLIILVQRVQIQHSAAVSLQHRLLDLTGEDIVGRTDGLRCLIEACEVHARCEALLGYARGEEAQPPATISAGDVGRSAFAIAPSGPLLDEVTAEIDRYAATSTWPEKPLPPRGDEPI